MTQSSPKILNGKWLAKQYQRAIKAEVEEFSPKVGRPPGLGVILVGDNPASKVYVGNKERVAKKRCGFETFDTVLPATATEEDVRSAILNFNEHPEVDGILLQLPLPDHLDSNVLLDCILPSKDADGLHPLNQGLLQRGEGTFRPCTPLGSLALIDLAFSDVDPEAGEFDTDSLPAADLSGLTAVVVGRSILVGKPVGTLLLERNATVVYAHSRTKDIVDLCRSADIIVAAVGVPQLVKGDWVKNGAIVIDVGINRLESGKLVGDVEYAAASKNARAITPVPGGVGPMTVTMLMRNTLLAYKAATVARAGGKFTREEMNER